MVVVNAFRLRSSRTTPRFGTNAIDIGPRDHWSRRNSKVDRLVERSVRMRYEFWHRPIDVFTPGQAKPFRARYRDSPALPLRSHLFFNLPSELWPSTVEKTLSTSRDDGVQIHQPGKLLRSPVCHRCNDDPSVAVPNEHHVGQCFVLQQLKDVFYVSLEAYVR
jgi:hypothetical protein